MKKLLVLVLVLLASFVSVSADLDVRMNDYSPNPVEPGEKFIVTFNIENLEMEDLVYEYKLTVNDPFYLSTSSTNEIMIGARDVEEIKFGVRVDEDATDVESTITYAYRIKDSGDAWTTKDFTIRIDNQASLDVVSVSSNPEVINKGERATLDIVLKNDGDVDLRDLHVELGLDNLPLAPYSSLNFEEIKELNKGKSKTISLDLIALDNANSGLYKVPILIQYEDDNGNDYIKTTYISVRVGALPELEIIPQTSFVISGQRNTVDIELVNKGDGNIEFLDVELFSSNGYRILGTSKTYVGNIDSDDYEDLSYDIFLDGDQLELRLHVSYKDDANQEYDAFYDVPVKTYTSSEAKDLGLIQQSKSYIWGIAIVVILVGFFLIRRRIRNKRKLEEE